MLRTDLERDCFAKNTFYTHCSFEQMHCLFYWLLKTNHTIRTVSWDHIFIFLLALYIGAPPLLCTAQPTNEKILMWNNVLIHNTPLKSETQIFIFLFLFFLQPFYTHQKETSKTKISQPPCFFLSNWTGGFTFSSWITVVSGTLDSTCVSVTTWLESSPLPFSDTMPTDSCQIQKGISYYFCLISCQNI